MAHEAAPPEAGEQSPAHAGPNAPGQGDRPPERSLGSRAKRASLWITAGFFLAQVVRMGASVVVTRLLLPADYGVMAIVNTIYVGLALFSDIGITQSVVQSKRDDAAFLNTAYTMQVTRGLILGLLGAALAWPMSIAYEEPRLLWLLPAVGATSMIAGLSFTRVMTLGRELNVGKVQAIRLTSQLGSTAVMIAWAFWFRSVWALALAHIAYAILETTLFNCLLPGLRNRLHWDKEAASSLIRFGRWIFLSTVMTFVVGRAQSLIFGFYVSKAQLGIYAIALMLSEMPRTIIGKLSEGAVFPYYSEAYRREGHLDHVFEKVRKLLLLAGGWAFSGLLAGGPVATRLLYAGEFEEAGAILQLLAIGGFLLTLNISHGGALLAMGQAKWVTASSVAKLVAMAVLLPMGYSIGESMGEGLAFSGMILGWSVSEAFRVVLSSYALSRYGISTIRNDLLYAALFTLIGGLGYYLCPDRGEWFSPGEAGDGTVSRFALGELLNGLIIAVLVSAAWVPIAWPTIRSFLARGRGA